MVYLRSRVLLDGMERREAISSAVNFFSCTWSMVKGHWSIVNGHGGHVKVVVSSGSGKKIRQFRLRLQIKKIKKNYTNNFFKFFSSFNRKEPWHYSML